MQNPQQEPSTSNNRRFQLTDTDNPLDIRYDPIFKAVFTKDTPASKGALSGLISALIERKITVSVITANEPPVKNAFDKHIRYDISCKAEKGELINIEMSFNPKPHELYRLEYYASRQFSGQDIQGKDKDYNDLVEFYQIAIIGNERIFKDDILVHTFQFYDPVHNVSLGGKSRIITVELDKTEQIVDKPISQMLSSERWSVFFQYLTIKDKRAKINEILEKEGDIAMAGETLIQISQNEREFAQRTSELKYILDKQDIEVTARREGFAKGLTKGHASGLTEGLTHGHQSGLAEGRAEEKIEIARNMQKAGISADVIFQTTGIQIKK